MLLWIDREIDVIDIYEFIIDMHDGCVYKP